MQPGRQYAGHGWLLCVFGATRFAQCDLFRTRVGSIKMRIIVFAVLSACNCNPFGSLPLSTCDVDTGQCLCQPFATGPHCEECIVCICLGFPLYVVAPISNALAQKRPGLVNCFPYPDTFQASLGKAVYAQKSANTRNQPPPF